MGYVRYALAVMMCLANMIFFSLKVNLSIAVVEMVKKSTIAEVEEEESSRRMMVACPNLERSASELSVKGEFDWDESTVGTLMGCYFYGYMLGMFPCGFFVNMINTKLALLCAVLGSAILTLLTPICASTHVYILYGVRFVLGVIGAIDLPAYVVLMSKWCVYEEKTVLMGIAASGVSFGSVFSNFSAAIIIARLGWAAVFYIQGIIPLIWCLVWFFFFSDNPEGQKFISEEERELICNSFGHRKPIQISLKIPWKSIFTSVPVWILLFTNFFSNFTFYTLVTSLPLYWAHIMRYNIRTNAFCVGSGFLITGFLCPTLGAFLDFGRHRNYWNLKCVRKSCQTLGYLIFIRGELDDEGSAGYLKCTSGCVTPTILSLTAVYIGCHRAAATTLLILAAGLTGTVFLGHLSNHTDLAPNYSGLLFGLTNSIGTVAGVLMPYVVGIVTADGNQTLPAWRTVFWICGSCQVTGWAAFVLFGSTDIQPWNSPEEPAPDESEVAVEKQETPQKVTT